MPRHLRRRSPPERNYVPFIEKCLHSFLGNGTEELLVRILIAGKLIIPNDRSSLIVDDFEGPRCFVLKSDDKHRRSRRLW